MKRVFVKAVANVKYLGRDEDSIIIDVNGEPVKLRLGDTFRMSSELAVCAPPKAMEYISRSFAQAGYDEIVLN